MQSSTDFIFTRETVCITDRLQCLSVLNIVTQLKFFISALVSVPYILLYHTHLVTFIIQIILLKKFKNMFFRVGI